MSFIYTPKVFLTYPINKEVKKENDMNIKKALLGLTIDEIVTCKQIVDFLSESIHIYMAQPKEDLKTK